MSDPVSKLSTYHRQQDYIGIGEVGLQQCYRSLDFLADISEDLQDHLYHQQRDLFNITLDVVFYDVTRSGTGRSTLMLSILKEKIRLDKRAIVKMGRPTSYKWYWHCW